MELRITNHSDQTSNNPWAIYPAGGEQRGCARYPFGQISAHSWIRSDDKKDEVRSGGVGKQRITAIRPEPPSETGDTTCACTCNGMLPGHLKFKCSARRTLYTRRCSFLVTVLHSLRAQGNRFIRYLQKYRLVLNIHTDTLLRGDSCWRIRF